MNNELLEYLKNRFVKNNNQHKSITFDKEAQDNLPQHIRDRMKADRDKSRRESDEKIIMEFQTWLIDQEMTDTRNMNYMRYLISLFLDQKYK